jgi:hypothetical protein
MKIYFTFMTELSPLEASLRTVEKPLVSLISDPLRIPY